MLAAWLRDLLKGGAKQLSPRGGALLAAAVSLDD
jgi:hypothetical protein